jgi:hypothetical protein
MLKFNPGDKIKVARLTSGMASEGVKKDFVYIVKRATTDNVWLANFENPSWDYVSSNFELVEKRGDNVEVKRITL